MSRHVTTGGSFVSKRLPVWGGGGEEGMGGGQEEGAGSIAGDECKCMRDRGGKGRPCLVTLAVGAGQRRGRQTLS